MLNECVYSVKLKTLLHVALDKLQMQLAWLKPEQLKTHLHEQPGGQITQYVLLKKELFKIHLRVHLGEQTMQYVLQKQELSTYAYSSASRQCNTYCGSKSS